MLEKYFIQELGKLGYKVDCQNGEDLRILKQGEEVARVSAFQPFRMETIHCPTHILELIVNFSSTKYDDRF